jgi:hypothetical protein
VKIPRDETFFAQARAFGLAYTCERCAFFHEASGRCVHGFPNHEHRADYYRRPGEWIVFCKDFELA